MPLWQLVLTFVIIATISYLNSSIDLISFVYFIVYTVFPYLYFVILINYKDDEEREDYNDVSKYLVFLVLIQIPVSIYKYITLGQGEHGLIGTISTMAGSMSTIFPLFAIALLFAKYLYDKKWIYLLLIAGFVLMALIGEKRAIGFYAPLVMILMFMIFKAKNKMLFHFSTLLNLLIIAALGLTFFYVSVRLNPSLNPENKMWGSFNSKFLKNYVVRYNTRDKTKKELQRVAAFKYFTKYLIAKKGSTLLIGEGSGKLVESKFKSDSGSMLRLYGVRYGGRTTFIWLWLQTGILGTAVYLIMILIIGFYLFKKYNHTFINLALIGCIIIYLFDFFSYSITFLKEFSLSISFYYILALFYIAVNRNTTEMPANAE